MARRVLVVATVPIEREALGERLRERLGEEPEVRVVAPASKLSRLDWLANDEDDARREAGRVAEHDAAELPGARPDEAAVGDPDPARAIEDALAQWPADEVLVVTDGARAGWLEKRAGEAARNRFGVPVTELRL